MSQGPGTGITEREDVAWRRRLLVFGESIRSDFGNPGALTWRALMRSLGRAGHEVVFIEPRRSESLTSLLRHRGSAPLRQFAERFPDIQYRTLELPRGKELAIWLARELALIDAVIVLGDASSEIGTAIDAYAEPGLIRFRADSSDGASRPPAGTSIRIVPVGGSTGDPGGDVLPIGPATTLPVSANRTGVPGRARVAILAWDAASAELAERTRVTVQDAYRDAPTYSLGTLTLPGWRPVTSLDIDDVLDGVDVALVVADPDVSSTGVVARSLLPWSRGVRAITIVNSDATHPVGLPGATVAVDQVVGYLTSDARTTAEPDLSPWSADAQAARIIATLDRLRNRERLSR